MSEPFLGEVCIVGFNFAPRGYAKCDGQLLSINQNQSLYAILGTTFGGDGRTSFALPDLRGRTPIHDGSDGGSTFIAGQKGGQEVVQLSESEIPAHNHTVRATTDVGFESDPSEGGVNGGGLPCQGQDNFWATPTTPTLVDMESGAVTANVGGQGHPNMQPFLALNFVIALQGLFPSRN